MCRSDQQLSILPFLCLSPLSRDVRNTFDSSFLRHYRCTGRRILVRLRSFIVLFFFSALDLAGLLVVTVGVSPTCLLVSWCDVCPHSAVVGQGRTHGQQGPVRIGGMLFLRDSLDLSFHQARVRTSTHLLRFSERPLDPRVLFFSGGLWLCFALESTGGSKLLHMFSSSDNGSQSRSTSKTFGNDARQLAVGLSRDGASAGLAHVGARPIPARCRKFS